MISGNATLVVDFGNSSTKCKVLYGKDPKTGKYRERQFELSNVFAPIGRDYEVSADYSDAESTILRVEIKVDGHELIGNFCNGELQSNEKPLSVIKPSAIAKKWQQDSTALSLRLALLYAYKYIAQIQRTTDLSQLDITWTIVTLLPPGDIDSGKAPMIELVKDCTFLESVFPDEKFDINIKNVAILPEGYCAYAGVVFDSGMVFRPDYKFLVNETVLIIDIGAGTTDICVVKDNKLVQNTKYTIPQGGNNVFQFVRRSLRYKGYNLDDDVIRSGVITGVVKDGAKSIDVVEDITNSKEEVGQKIVSEIQNFLELTDLKARSVGYVLICGGGSMNDSDRPEIHPLSEYVMSSFKQLSPNSEIIKIPDHTVKKEMEDGDVISVTEQISPRELNLIGATMMAELY